MISNKKKILIVDDEADIREVLQFNLENEGFEVDQAESAEKALEIVEEGYDIILLDVMMNGMSGFRMAEKLRKSGNETPIVFVTAKGTENDMLTGFSTGGDDYISKPFSIKEVIARVKSVLKRAGKYHAEPEVSEIRIENMFIDLVTKQLFIDDRLVELTKTEFKILVLLVQNEMKIFSRNDILERVWDNGEVVLERTVDVHIARLRKKIGDYGAYIVNRTGYGYTFIVPRK